MPVEWEGEPLLIATKEGLQLFADAVVRGVEVSILTNSLCSTDNLQAFNSARFLGRDSFQPYFHGAPKCGTREIPS